MRRCLSAKTLFLIAFAIMTPSALGHSSNYRELQDNDEQQELFDEAFAKWTNVVSSFPDNLVDYNFAYLQGDEMIPQYQVAVRNSTSLDLDTIYPLRLDETYFTIDQLMTYISEALAVAGKNVSATYDKTYGYPTSWKFDFNDALLEGTMYSFTFFSVLKQTLGESKEIWSQQEISSYDCTMQLIGFLPPSFTMPMRVEVRDGAIVNIFYEGTGERVDVPVRFPTIEQAFTNIENALNNYYANVDVTFDPELGFPLEYTLTESIWIADGDASYRIYDVQGMEDDTGNAGNGTVLEDDAQTQLDAAKTLWQAQNMSTYNYTFQRSCECPPQRQLPKLVEVVDGLVVAIDGSPVETTGPNSLSLDEAPTLDGLFTIIQDAINENAFRVGITYDEQYGYPTSIGIDYDETVADEELFVTAKLEVKDNGGGTTKDDDETQDDAQTKLDSAKSTWEAKGLTNYHFGIFKECRCRFRDPISIQVSNGEVMRMYDRYGGEVYQNLTGYSLTIEEIFDLIKDGIDSNFSTVDVDYDEEYGFPTTVVLDASAMTADDEYTLRIEYLAPLTEWQNDLEAGKSLWQAKNLSTYNFTYQRSCECPPQEQMPKLVQVVDGMVLAIDGSPVQATQRSSSLSPVPTFGGLFTIIQDAINANAFRIRVSYDQQYGYPTSIFIDYEEMVADEELIATVKLEEVKDNGGGAEYPDPYSSGAKLAAIIGQVIGFAFILP